METIINLAERLAAAEGLLYDYVEQDSCVCDADTIEEGACLFCSTQQYLEDIAQ